MPKVESDQITSEFTYIDLFAGCGGLSLGLSNAGWKGIFAIEKSEDAFKTLEHNLINKKSHFNWPYWLPQTALDIKKVLKNYPEQLKALRNKVDMVTGGPPCQGFSTAGKRNEKDKRNKLIYSYIKFIELVQPKILFFENVKGFTMEFDKNKSKGKRYSDYVVNKITSLGYDVHPELINFADYGVPQKRCRFILVGIRKDICKAKKIEATNFFDAIRLNKEKFLVERNLKVSTPLEEAISDLLMKNGTQPLPGMKKFQAGIYAKVKSDYQAYLRGNLKPGIMADSHRFANHKTETKERFSTILDIAEKGKSISEELKNIFHIKKRTVVPLNAKDQAPTITTLPDDYIHYSEPRILTVREYARIQSFPDAYEFKGKYTTGGKRRTQEVPRYTQIGNAIPPLFGEQSGIALKKLINTNGR